ncbi:MAG: serine/threonine protein kinase [Gemmataceae bacterium]
MNVGEKIGKFQVISTLGTGAHSTILHVRRAADGKQYALKVVPLDGPEDHKFLEQARHEFQVAGMLDSPNCLKAFALEEKRDWLFRVKKAHLLVEYVNGKTLDKMPVMPCPKLVQIFHKVAQALVHMHRRQVVHADLKPGNLMLSRAGQVKVLDFGLAWIKGKPKDRVQGTPEYMAPETAKHKTVNQQTDIFNFGATMYRLVTFRMIPPTGAALEGMALDSKAWTNRLEPVSKFSAEAPKELCDLIHHCLAHKAHDRPERMSDVAAVLEGLSQKLVTSSADKLEALEW